MALVDSLIVFVVSLLIGGLGIFVGGRLLTGETDYAHALVTALIGAIVWGVLGFLVGWIPLLGPLLVLLAYVTVINLRYPGGYLDAIGIALIAWIASLVVLWILAALRFTTFEAAGVPGA